jgi:hypothetical protein
MVTNIVLEITRIELQIQPESAGIVLGTHTLYFLEMQDIGVGELDPSEYPILVLFGDACVLSVNHLVLVVVLDN